MSKIEFSVKNEKYQIPNSWEELTPAQFEGIITDLNQVSKGKLSPAMLQVNHVCRTMGWDSRRLLRSKDENTLSNLAWLGEQVDFIFRISYPDNDAALQDLSPKDIDKAKKMPPERLSGLSIARYLSSLDYKFTLNSCFCTQLIPAIRIGENIYQGYGIDTGFNRLTCSLTALQYIEARALIGCSQEQLPLLAAILYHPGTYNSESAHALAKSFRQLPAETLQGIDFNFLAFTNYLFTQTDFRILVAGTLDKQASITTGALESLYNLSSDGYGDITAIEQMNLIKYLTILRKKLIEAVQSMSSAEMNCADISKKTGLPISLIKQII